MKGTPISKHASSSTTIGFSHNEETVPWRDHWMQSVYYPVSVN